MQEGLINAYLERRGFHGSIRVATYANGAPMKGPAVVAYREWVFAWVDELTKSLPPR